MKRIITAFLLLFMIIPAYADDDKSSSAPETPLLTLEVDGKLYYLTDEKMLQELLKSEACIQDSTNGDIATLFKLLYQACAPSIGPMADEVNALGYKGTSISSKFDAWLVRQGQKMTDYCNANDKVSCYKNALKSCVLTKEKLQYILSQEEVNRPKFPVTITTDIDKCIAGIDTIDNEMMLSNTSCPVKLTVVEHDIENIKKLNTDYISKTFHFYKEIDINPSKIMVFNGNVLVACENGTPKYIVKPTYSGRESCQNGVYSNLSGLGGTPNGLYIVQEKDKITENDTASWGEYRFPLIPAAETDTHGRTNMYLHGTSDPNKHRSAGCISLGLNISDFVNTNFISGSIPVIVKIDNVYQDWKHVPETKTNDRKSGTAAPATSAEFSATFHQ